MNHACAHLAALVVSLFAVLQAAPAADPPSSGVRMLRDVLAEARVRPVRIFHGGTSIQCTPYGGLRWLENLRHTYGDSGNSTSPVRVLGGSLAPYAGWRKQSGGLMVRLRGDSASRDLILHNTFGKKLIIDYAVEPDGGSCDVYVDDEKAGTIDCGGPQAYDCQVAALNAASGSSDYVPTEFTWVGVPPGADAKAWEVQQWHSKANWSDRIAPAEYPGATVTIERWPVDGNNAYGGPHGITLAYSTATIGRLHLGGDGGAIAAGTHPTAGTGRLVFDNRGQPAEIKGISDGTATIRAAVHSNAALRLDAGTMKSIAVIDYAGPGELLVVGRTDSGVNNASLGFESASGCRKITVEPGARLTISGSSISPPLQDIIVNGTLELATAGATNVTMQAGQTISGNGTVRVVAANPAQARVKTVAGARIVAGAASPGPLTFADTRLCLGGGTVECALGEKANAKIATSHGTQRSLAIGGEPDSAKTTVKIIDAGRTSAGTVPLFSYTGPLSGDVATLGLELPPRWRATLVENRGNSTIDLQITAIEP